MNGPRRGKSLIEALVAMSLFAAALATSTTTLAALYRIERLTRRDAEQAAALDRLAQRLRADAHAAISCRADGRCWLTLADGREVQYSAAPPVVTREVRDQGQVVHRDSFYLVPHAAAAFETTSEASGQLVRLTVRPEELPASGGPPVSATTIIAAIHPATESMQRGTLP